METLIRKISDFVLLNAYSTESSGFYNGKAGISLALFEVSRLLKDEYLEEHAFELLQEALLYKGDDMSFASGYFGISFVLHYLVENDFVEADIDDLLGEQEQKIQLASREVIPISQLAVSTLSTCIDRLYLLRCASERNREEIEQLEAYLFSSSEEELERKLLEIMLPNGINVGYAHGLVRWLLYAVYVGSLQQGVDVSRFKSLFKMIPVWKR